MLWLRLLTISTNIKKVGAAFGQCGDVAVSGPAHQITLPAAGVSGRERCAPRRGCVPALIRPKLCLVSAVRLMGWAFVNLLVLRNIGATAEMTGAQPIGVSLWGPSLAASGLPPRTGAH